MGFMDYVKDYSSFAGFNLIFSFSIIVITFILGWLLYNNLILGKICLKDSLFEKDNVAAWVEFIGAFVFPTLFLASKAIEGPANDNIWKDLLICIGYVVVFIGIFTILRLLSNSLVGLIAAGDHEGKISLNNEIYKQKNTAAALFSVALSVIFASIIRFFNVMGILNGFADVEFLKMASVLVFSLAAFAVYIIVLRRKTTLFKEIFIDNNIAAGVSFLGFIFAVQIILDNIIILQQGEFDIIAIALMSLISLILFGVLSMAFKWIFTKLIKVDIWKEVYEQDSVGAALGQVALYVGIASVIINFLK